MPPGRRHVRRTVTNVNNGNLQIICPSAPNTNNYVEKNTQQTIKIEFKILALEFNRRSRGQPDTLQMVTDPLLHFTTFSEYLL